MILRALILIGALAAGVAQAQQVPDIAGWNNTRWGMNPEQLRTALGPALLAEQSQIGLVRYSMKDVSIGGVPFDVHLLVNPIGLTDVAFGSGFVNRARDTEAAAVEAALRAQYGNDPEVIDKESMTPGDGRSVYRELNWRFPSTTVRFLHNLEISSAATNDHLSVTFSRPR